jgi:hypothetical protein
MVAGASRVMAEGRRVGVVGALSRRKLRG